MLEIRALHFDCKAGETTLIIAAISFSVIRTKCHSGMIAAPSLSILDREQLRPPLDHVDFRHFFIELNH